MAPPPLSHGLLARLAHARKAANLTQAELAERAGLSRMTVQRLESGSLDPRLSTLQELARVLNMELHAVQAEPAVPAEPAASAEAAQLLTA